MMNKKGISSSYTMPSINQDKVRATSEELTFKEKMQLRKHLITNILAVVIIVFYLIAVVVQTFKGNLDVIQELRVLVFIIVGYYFGRGVDDGN